MTTINALATLDSDSDNDPDFVPDNAADSDSESSANEPVPRQTSGVTTEAEAAAQKQRVHLSLTNTPISPPIRARATLWAEFEASVAAPLAPSPDATPKQMVKIEKRFRFAGEDVVEVTEVPEDSEDAKKWPLWRAPDAAEQTDAPSTPSQPSASSQQVSEASASTGASKSTPARRPGPRKPKTALAPLPGAVGKAKKLSTLDKSAMDWRAHVAAEAAAGTGVKDELEANRRGGGYLEKVEFMGRVEQRKEEILEQEKSAKRRRL